jgi:predicted nucleotidyltransferase
MIEPWAKSSAIWCHGNLLKPLLSGFRRTRFLFGSWARGDAAADSDIDLLVLFPEVSDPRKRIAELHAILGDYSRAADIVVSTTSRFERYRNVVNTVYWPASREGKVLYERAA